MSAMRTAPWFVGQVSQPDQCTAILSRSPPGTISEARAGLVDEAAVRSVLTQRLTAVEERLTAACQRAGRPRADVRLVAVTKTVSAAVAALLPQLGALDLGESRPQELVRKAARLPAEVRWHLIGHLQRNKIDAVLPHV